MPQDIATLRRAAPTDRVATGWIASLLFTPGDRLDRVQKALATSVQVVCLDLEDAVAPAAKSSARTGVLQFLENAPLARCAVRMNAIRSADGLADLVAFTGGGGPLPLILVPKVESADEVAIIAAHLVGRAAGFLPLIETSRGLANAASIGSVDGVVGLMLGGADLAEEIGAEISWDALRYGRSHLVHAAAQAGVPAIDVPYLDITDLEGLELETRRIKALGFSGKAAIHPRQVDVIARVFEPSKEEVQEARDAIAAFEAGGGAAVRFRGGLLDAPLMPRYRRILLRAGCRAGDP